MGVLGSSCSFYSSLFIGFVLVLNAAVFCNGGKTSSFVRKVEKTIDMPLNSDVFGVPPGYNAPQQVGLLPYVVFLFLNLLILYQLFVTFSKMLMGIFGNYVLGLNRSNRCLFLGFVSLLCIDLRCWFWITGSYNTRRP